MSFDERKVLIESIQSKRNNRTLISLCNFDRISNPELPGLATQFHADLKESLFRVLKENPTDKGIDIFLYTRGGDTNSVWPIASLIREFDADFEVLVPFRAHSAGTLLALAAKKIIMTRLGELSPIDPMTGNQFNPQDPLNKAKLLSISVEDVKAYREFILQSMNTKENDNEEIKKTFLPFLSKLIETIHPLAIGNVHRVYALVSRLAKKLLKFHISDDKEIDRIIKLLTVETYSHQHMIGRIEAQEILGDKVVFANEALEIELDKLLRKYEDDFGLRSPLFAMRLMDENTPKLDFKFIGGILESKNWGYKFQTTGKITQFSRIPQNVNVQIPPGQSMPLIPGLPREYIVEVHEQKWRNNKLPEGVTL